MKIDRFFIRDFRNLSAVDLVPAARLNIFAGSNAQGKTNLLEAIQVLASGSSFRRAGDRDLLMYESEAYALRCLYTVDDRKLEAVLKYQPEYGKRLLINQKKVGLTHPDRLRVVSFTPDDLLLIKGGPDRRRSFLDNLLRQLSVEYAYRLENYNKTLKKRNYLLKIEKTDNKKQAAIDDVFLENGSYLMLKRLQLLNVLNDYLHQFFYDEERDKKELRLKYSISLRVDRAKITLETLQEAFRDNMKVLRGEELRRGRSMVGPHLDDFNIYLDGRNAAFYASQGQQRNIIISLKWSELYSVHRISGHYPILLLDEVLAELDHPKQERLLKRLSEAPFQSFMSSVNLETIRSDLSGRIWQVKRGEIELRGNDGNVPSPGE